MNTLRCLPLIRSYPTFDACIYEHKNNANCEINKISLRENIAAVKWQLI